MVEAKCHVVSSEVLICLVEVAFLGVWHGCDTMSGQIESVFTFSMQNLSM